MTIVQSHTSLKERGRLVNDAQESILVNGQRLNLSLNECLRLENLSINDLRYTANSFSSDINQYKKIEHSDKINYHGIPVVSFFAGAGGMDIGLEQAGFEHVALFEHNEIFCQTMRQNRPYWQVIGPPHDLGDVSNTERTIEILKKRFSLQRGFPGVFTGGPPCQPFSIAANQRFKKNIPGFKRIGYKSEKNGKLLFDFGKIIKYFRPHVFLVENVTGLSDVDGGHQLSIFCNDMNRAGYDVSKPVRLRAEMFGVPQCRERLFIVGSRSKRGWIPPQPWKMTIPCGRVLTKEVEYLENHQMREHKIESVLRYRVLDFGKRDHMGRVDRLDPKIPSKTVIAGGLIGGGRSHLHPWVPRTLSVRESARLQTFPDNYVFSGPMARQFTQVGNAVPPLLSKQLAESIYTCFYAKKLNKRAC